MEYLYAIATITVTIAMAMGAVGLVWFRSASRDIEKLERDLIDARQDIIHLKSKISVVETRQNIADRKAQNTARSVRVLVMGHDLEDNENVPRYGGF